MNEVRGLRYEPRTKLEDIKARAAGRTIYYAIHTCWWTDDRKDLGKLPGSGLPCDPRGSVLMMTEDGDGASFIAEAEKNPAHYGEHGLRTFESAYHGNVTTADGRPTSLRTWAEYHELVERGDQSKVLALAAQKLEQHLQQRQAALLARHGLPTVDAALLQHVLDTTSCGFGVSFDRSRALALEVQRLLARETHLVAVVAHAQDMADHGDCPFCRLRWNEKVCPRESIHEDFCPLGKLPEDAIP